MDANLRAIGLHQPEEWRAALDGIPHGYWHTWAAHEAWFRGTGEPSSLFTYTDESGGRAACPFTTRTYLGRNDIYTPLGFAGFALSGTGPRVRSAWQAFAADSDFVCGYFALHPVWADMAANVHSGVRDSNELLLLDLRDGSEAVLARSDRSVRRGIRDWLLAGAPYVTDRAALCKFLQAQYEPFMRSMGASPRAIWPAATLAAMLEDPAVWIVGAADEDGICAAYSFATTPHSAECHLNVSVRDGRTATTALLWWGIEQLACSGVPWLCMGGGVAPGDSIARAKLKFRPEVHPLRSAREVYRFRDFEELCEAAGCTEAAARFFPPYRA
jgi:hypothetical protein